MLSTPWRLPGPKFESIVFFWEFQPRLQHINQIGSYPQVGVKKNKCFKPLPIDNGVPATHTSPHIVNGRLISFHLWHHTMSAHGNSILKSSPCCITAWDHRQKPRRQPFGRIWHGWILIGQVLSFRFIGLKLWKRKNKEQMLRNKQSWNTTQKQ